ncbi:hypothetical protein H312_02937, partial [Anncaliia algerae PRA339]
FDGSTNNTEGVVEFEFKYNYKFYKEEFNFIKNDEEKNIIIENSLVKQIDSGIRELPMECRINTQGKDLISWSRPIRSQKDKKDFEMLLEKLEKDKILNQIHQNG